MKQTQRTLAVLVLFSVLSISCASAPPQTQLYKGAVITARAVDDAMTLVGELYRAGKITEVQKANILNMYTRYQSAARTLVYLSMATTTSGQDIEKLKLDVALAASSLIDFIVSLRS